MRALTLLVALALIGCADQPKRPECQTEYAHTIDHCPKKKRYAATVEECKRAGGVSIIKDGRFTACVSQDSLWRILRGHQP